MIHNIQKAELLTRFLVRWHLDIWRELASTRLDPQSIDHYLERVDFFHALDLSDPRNMQQIASEQIWGMFEVFYAEPVPEQMWYRMCQEHDIELPRPNHLGDVGHQILELIKEAEFKERRSQVFQLLEGWPDKPVLLNPERVEIPLRSGETPRQALRRYFVELGRLESQNIGGRELLVSMNEDLLREIGYEGERDSIAVYNPASFEFQLVNAQEKDNIVIHAMKGQVCITKVVLGGEETEERGGKEQ